MTVPGCRPSEETQLAEYNPQISPQGSTLNFCKRPESRHQALQVRRSLLNDTALPVPHTRGERACLCSSKTSFMSMGFEFHIIFEKTKLSLALGHTHRLLAGLVPGAGAWVPVFFYLSMSTS